MGVQLSPIAMQRFYDNNNNPLVGGQLFTYQAGTTTPQATYTDGTGATANPNPVIMNARGEAPVWLSPTQSYKLVLCDFFGNTIWTCDNVTAPAPVALGNMTDELGIGGTPGFAANVDFTPGTSTTLTLSTNYGTASNLWVTFDGAEQGADTFTLSGKVLTFNSAIPAGTNKVYVKGGASLALNYPANGSVTGPTIAPHAVGDNALAWAGILCREVGTITNLRLLSSTVYSRAATAGYYAAGDGGGGQYYLDSSDTTSADNGGTIIVGTDGGRWKLIRKGPVSARQFGMNPSQTDNSAAFTAALAYCATLTANAELFIEEGVYPITSNVGFTFAAGSTSVMIQGAGAGTTVLKWTSSGGGLTLNFINGFNAVFVRDLSLITTATNSGTALLLNQTAASVANPANTAVSEISNISIHGADGYEVTQCWNWGIQCSGVSNVNFIGVDVSGSSTQAGNGVNIFGTATTVPVVFNFSMCTFNAVTTGISYGAYAQGITVAQCNFTGTVTGIWNPPSGTSADQLCVSGSQFNCSASGIRTDAGIPSLLLSNNLFISEIASGSVGIILNNAGVYSIVNNNFGGNLNLTQGISIPSTTSSGAIVGNIFYKLNVGISLGSSTAGVNVQSNAYNSCNTNIANTSAGNTIGGGSS